MRISPDVFAQRNQKIVERGNVSQEDFDKIIAALRKGTINIIQARGWLNRLYAKNKPRIYEYKNFSFSPRVHQVVAKLMERSYELELRIASLDLSKKYVYLSGQTRLCPFSRYKINHKRKSITLRKRIQANV